MLLLRCAQRWPTYRIHTAYDCTEFYRDDGRNIFSSLAHTRELERDALRRNHEAGPNAAVIRRQLTRVDMWVRFH